MSEGMTVAVGLPDLSTVDAPRYANIVHISSTPYDFRITFSLLTTPHEQRGQAGGVSDLPFANLTPQAVAEVVLPAGAVESVVELLRAEMDRFVERFGPPRPDFRQGGRPALGRRWCTSARRLRGRLQPPEERSRSTPTIRSGPAPRSSSTPPRSTPATATYGNDRVGFSATGSIDRDEFGLTWDAAIEGGGLVVSNTIRLTADAEFIRRPPSG
ncbi:MAG: YceI family protein [Acidimicrobiales bacterium]